PLGWARGGPSRRTRSGSAKSSAGRVTPPEVRRCLERHARLKTTRACGGGSRRRRRGLAPGRSVTGSARGADQALELLSHDVGVDDGLREVVVAPDGERLLLVAGHGLRGERDNADGAADVHLPDATGGLPA